MRISLCVIALDEQDLIGGLLDNVCPVVDEIVVGVDDRTSDSTADIAALRGAKVQPFTWRDDFSAARNMILDLATSDWVLVLDPDERLTPEGIAMLGGFRNRLNLEPAMATFDGFQFLRAELDLAGVCHATNRTTARLFRIDTGIRYRGVVHEEPLSAGPEPARWCLVNGAVAINHIGYAPELWTSRKKHELYLRLLERRVAADPTDEYARFKLAQERAMNAAGIVQH